MGALPRVYICDENPRMRQIIADRLDGHAEVIAAGDSADDAADAVAGIEADVVILDYRTAVGRLEDTIAAIRDGCPRCKVVVHTGVPRALIEEQVAVAGGVYASKNEPDQLVALVRGIRVASRAGASRGS